MDQKKLLHVIQKIRQTNAQLQAFCEFANDLTTQKVQPNHKGTRDFLLEKLTCLAKYMRNSLLYYMRLPRLPVDVTNTSEATFQATSERLLDFTA